MMWGCMTSYGTGPIQQIIGNMNQYSYMSILQFHLPETTENMPYPQNEVMFQQDRDPMHIEKSVQNWLNNQNFKLLDWPAQSPDLNPIENLWAHLKKKLHCEYHTMPTSTDNLWIRVQEEWNKISPDYCERLIQSMLQRIHLVSKAKGLRTKY
ncbi:Transposable element Tcb1 transposase [Anthophora retusa]